MKDIAKTGMEQIFLGVKAERAKWEFSGLTTTMTERGTSQHVFKVEGDLAKFSDSQLIAHCDRGRRNFGGRVTRQDGKALVVVYVD